jgi:hypothetical protein
MVFPLDGVLRLEVISDSFVAFSPFSKHEEQQPIILERVHNEFGERSRGLEGLLSGFQRCLCV